jgi:hypothetical protein
VDLSKSIGGNRMPFNGPIDGDYTNVDLNKAPWTSECMTLTHEECLHVLDGIKQVIENYDPSTNYGQPLSDSQTHSDYNRLDWQYAISWDTYTTLKQYDPEVHKDGITEQGIVGTYEEQIPEGPAE